MQGLRVVGEAEGTRLLRVLLIWFGSVPTRSGTLKLKSPPKIVPACAGRKTTGTVMTSFSLTRPKIPLAAALSQMLENIEAELAGEELEVADERRLRRRAELIRWLLTPRPIT